MIIEVCGLKKVFRRFQRREGLSGALHGLFSREYIEVAAVAGITFGIRAGEIVGFVGPNGAGKSTTVKMLTGILMPTSSQVRVAGLVPHRQRIATAKEIGVVFGQRSQLWWDIPVVESLRLLKAIYEVPDDLYRENLALFAEVLDLDALLSVPVRQLSLGQRMRCDLAAALLHNPPIVFLDEPTIGLDVAVKERIREFVRFVNRERGTTVLLTTHDLRDIEELCRRLIIIDKGRIIFDGALSEVVARAGGDRFLVCEVRDPYPQSSPEGAEGIDIVRREERRLWVRLPTEGAAQAVARVLERYTVLDLTIEEPGIESVVKQLYRQDIR